MMSRCVGSIAYHLGAGVTPMCRVGGPAGEGSWSVMWMMCWDWKERTTVFVVSTRRWPSFNHRPVESTARWRNAADESFV